MAITLGGKAEVAINGTVIPAQFLSEVSVAVSEGTRERKTLGGTFKKPSGVLDTAEAKFTLFLPAMDYLKEIFPERYNAPNGNLTGNIVINSDTCGQAHVGPVNIHFTCEPNDNNDVHIFNGSALLNFNPTYSTDADVMIEVTIFAEPDDSGNIVRIGTGDLTKESIYDEISETTIPVVS